MIPTLRDRCLGIEFLLLDVDGVLTEGDITYGALAGEPTMEVKAFHVRDGSGLKRWHQAGKRSAILTGRTSPLVELRAQELGIEFVRQGAADKATGLDRLARESKIDLKAICYIGDDFPDVPAMRQVGLAVAVADACPEARAVAHYITRAPGGRGAVGEVVERILRCR
jgi:YrbI family 3-deoxy-D-manno-octulosonate 8-phosphate phosphatase